MRNIGLSVFFCICLWRSVFANDTSTTTTKIPLSSTSLKSSSPTTTAAPVTTKSSGTPTTVTPTTAPVTCSQRNASCGECVKDIKCFWCGADDSCRKYPASKIVPRDCKENKWYWKQCVAAGIKRVVGKIRLIYFVGSVWCKIWLGKSLLLSLWLVRNR